MPDLRGIGVSPGRTAGPVVRMGEPPALTGVSLIDPRSALDQVARELTRRSSLAEGSAAEILEAEALMAADPMLLDEAERLAGEGMDTAHAIDAACAAQRESLVEAGGYFAERAADLDDIRNRAVAAAQGLPMPGIPVPGHPFVLVAEDLSPADTAALPRDVLAIVTEKGGPTGHTAIIARARALPAVVACAEALTLPEGAIVSVDGVTGEIVTGLTAQQASVIVERDGEERAKLRSSRGPGRTADGHPVALLLNIGSAADLEPGAEGVGLFRTEFLYLGRASAPTFDEQVAAYAEVFRRCEKVVVRTLDAGTDKPLPFLGLPEEPNPALGIRGLRVDRVRPGVLDTQLDAIAEAARRAGADAWVMAPMVTTVREAARFAERARARGIRHTGVMVEVPAAALQADALLGEVDFLSIGTNDLSQYTFAADRQHSDLADLLDPWQPALLRLVAECARAGQRTGKPVGVCGEAAADPRLATILVGLGVTSLSMAAPSVPAVREALATTTLDECRRQAESATAG